MRAILRNLLTLAASAAATMAVAMAFTWPGQLDATGSSPTENPRPSLAVGDVKFSVASAKTTYAPGEAATFTVRAVNDGNAAVSAKCTVHVMVMPAVLAMSRSEPIPQKSWSKEIEVNLAPGQASTVDLAPDVTLPPAKARSAKAAADANSSSSPEVTQTATKLRLDDAVSGTIVLTDGKNSVNAWSFSIEPAKAAEKAEAK